MGQATAFWFPMRTAWRGLPTGSAWRSPRRAISRSRTPTAATSPSSPTRSTRPRAAPRSPRTGSQLEYSSLDNAPRGVQGPGDHMYLTDPEGGHRRELHSPGGFGWFVGWRPAAPTPKGTRPCVLRGTNGADLLVGSRKGDLIYGRGGNDVVRGRGGDDVIVGDAPYSAHPGEDRLYGGPGRDFIDAYDGRRDVVNGGAGKDRGMFDEARARQVDRDAGLMPARYTCPSSCLPSSSSSHFEISISASRSTPVSIPSPSSM